MEAANIADLRGAGLMLLVALLAFLQLWSPTIQSAEPPALREVGHIVTLVHGTWGIASPWIRQESHFNKALRSELGDGVLAVPFYWTGQNGHRARRRAAAELTRHVLRIASSYPGVPHFLVAHSHGGNVCMYALRDLSDASIIAGVTCMATPFICTQPRDLGPVGPRMLQFFASIPIFISVAFLSWFIWKSAGLHFAWWMLALLPIYLLGVFICLEIVGPIALDPLAIRAHERAKRIDTTPKKTLNLLILRALGDEAAASLGFAQIGNVVLHHTWTVPAWLIAILINLLAGILLYLLKGFQWAADYSLSRFGFVGRLLFVAFKITGGAIFFLLFATGAAIAFLAAVTVSVLILAAWILGACALHLAGIGNGSISPIIEVTAEPAPKGKWTVRTFAAREPVVQLRGPFGKRSIIAFGDVNREGIRTLAHSASYDNAECVLAVAEWIKVYAPSTMQLT